MKRLNLKCFRTKHKLTQQEMADKIGVPRIKYARIENGTAAGKLEFWETLQNAFGIPNEEMWALTIKE